MSTPSVRFPQDDGHHNHIVEWWYFNGHLTTASQEELAYMYCLFRVDNQKVNLPFLKEIPIRELYFSHWQIANLTKNTLKSKINYLAWPERHHQSTDRLDLEYIDYANLSWKEGYQASRLFAVDDSIWKLKSAELDLTFDSQKDPLLVGGTGYVKGPKASSYYYSRTELSTTGTVEQHGQPVAVTGVSWFDHQWANTSFRPMQWNWFSLQLLSGVDLVVYEFIDSHGERTLNATRTDRRNRQQTTTQVIITPLSRNWQSPQTLATYPLDWRLELPEWDLTVEVTARRAEQEMIFGTINYWEGPVAVVARAKRAETTGVGYMELVGYPVKKIGVIRLQQEISRLFLKR